MRNPHQFGKWDFPTSPTFASSPGHFEPGFCQFIPKKARTPAGEPNLVGNPPSRKWQIGIWASPGPHLGTGLLAFNLPRKNGVPRPWATHHRLRLTETVSLLRKSWGVLWICQSGASKLFSGCIKPRAPLEQLPPAVFEFSKIGYLGLGGPFPSQSGRFAETVTKNGASQDTAPHPADLQDLAEMGHAWQFGP